ncbi:glycosyltransferase [Flavobacterium sp. 5]|uniref:glycosyltransferase family 2 protein n=1 Tax=Flavobacterium sp. 5 TaxID=2035199 RepID=UPI000C2CC582|nr:glycosyltransferase [Flavobacterium sp. 5]PKB17458.1 hypothetical protein CLU82_2658 [Flavobacterium sp. 5]
MVVSVIVPCYNQGDFLDEALESVYNQIYTDWECIIVDDGSTDDTETIAQRWVSKDNRFKYFYKKNNGVSSARNFGIAKASGKYIQFLDSDDILDSRKMQLSIDKLKEDKSNELGIVVSNFNMLSSDSKEVLPPFCEMNEKSLTFENFLFHFFSIQLQCGFFDIKLFESIKFPENLSAQEDWIVWINLFKDNPKFVFIDLPLAFYRINPSGRMNTIGADDNQIKVLGSLREILTYDQYHKFSVGLLTRYYDSTKLFRNNLKAVKKSNTYQGGLMIKKGLNTFGVLKFVKQILKKALKFKAK